MNAEIGHNRGPLITADQLALDHEDLQAERDELNRRADALPETITSDEEQERVATLVRDAGAFLKRCETRRETQKQPFLQAGRTVDNFFGVTATAITKTKSRIEARITTYLRAKAEAERRRREQEEEVAREAARLAREEADRKIREAEALADAARVQEQASREANREANAAIRESFAADDAAARAARDADAAARAATARAADLARTRGAETLSTLVTKWEFEIVDAPAIPLDALRPYLSRDAIDRAIRGYMNAGDPAMAKLDGVRFYAVQRARVT